MQTLCYIFFVFNSCMTFLLALVFCALVLAINILFVYFIVVVIFATPPDVVVLNSTSNLASVNVTWNVITPVNSSLVSFYSVQIQYQLTSGDLFNDWLNGTAILNFVKTGFITVFSLTRNNFYKFRVTIYKNIEGIDYVDSVSNTTSIIFLSKNYAISIVFSGLKMKYFYNKC